MQSNFHITYSQPTFELPWKPIVLLADRASLAMVPRATAGLNSSPAMESQLINPPPSPTCVESHSTVTNTFPNNSFNDVMGQLMNQLGHEVDTMKFHQITSNPSLTSIDRCHNIQEILSQAHSYALTTRHSLNETVDLSSPWCLLNWAEPFIVNAATISLTPFRISVSLQANFILLTSLVSSLSSLFPMHSSTILPNLTPQFVIAQLTRWSHPTNLLCTLLFANGRRILPGSIQNGIRLSSGWEGKGHNFHRFGQNIWAGSRTLYQSWDIYMPIYIFINRTNFVPYRALYAVEFYVIFGRNFHWLFHFI